MSCESHTGEAGATQAQSTDRASVARAAIVLQPSEHEAGVLKLRFWVPETRFINIYKHKAQASECISVSNLMLPPMC